MCQHYSAKTTGHWYCYLQPHCGDTRWQCRYTIHQESKCFLFYFRWRDVYSKTIMYLRTHMCCITFPTPRYTFQITQVCMVLFAVNGQHVGNKRWLIRKWKLEQFPANARVSAFHFPLIVLNHWTRVTGLIIYIYTHILDHTPHIYAHMDTHIL